MSRGLLNPPLTRDAILAEARLKQLKASINDPEAAMVRWHLAQLRDADKAVTDIRRAKR